VTREVAQGGDTRTSDRRRVLFIGHGRTPDELTKRKWDAVSELIEIRAVVESDDPAVRQDPRFVALVPIRSRLLRGAAFYARLPVSIRRELREHRPDAIVTQSPYDALLVLLARKVAEAEDIPLIVEVHGDWRIATRLYGSRWRTLLAPLGDRAAVWALRQADAIRTISPATTKIVEEAAEKSPTAVFPTFHDAETYFSSPPSPLPDTPTALWVGSLQRSKNPELLVRAWHSVAGAVPEARLVVVGTGPLQPLVDELHRESPARVRLAARLSPAQLKHEFDAATALVLPSRSEGLGRVIIESFARGRPVIGTRVGGISDLVEHGVNGLLVPSDDAPALVEAMITLLRDRTLASRLGHHARSDAEAHHWTPDRYARAVFGLIEETLVRAQAEVTYQHASRTGVD
jgi:glycosyltransferase involved in cell wall biosynthesis